MKQQKIFSKGSGMSPFTPSARLSVPTTTHTHHPLKRAKAAPTIDGEPERTQQTTSGNDGNE